MNKVSYTCMTLFRRFFSVNKTLRNEIPNEFDFDSSKEILENQLDNVMLIGINLPDSKNLLTEIAVEKLCETLSSFENNEKVSVGVLHGVGGNFCTGVVPTEKASKKCREVIEVMEKAKKPLIASLNGYTSSFGFQLALMCDLRIMEESSVARLGTKNEKEYIPPNVYRRLAATVGFPQAMEICLLQHYWAEDRCKETGFSNFTVSCGAGLGQAIVWAQSIALAPQSKVLKQKHKVLSLYELTGNET